MKLTCTIHKTLLSPFLVLERISPFFKRPKIVPFRGHSFFVLPRVFPPLSHQTGFFLDSIALKQGTRVVDVGCGAGVLSICLFKKGMRFVCVDISPDALTCTRVNAALNRVPLRVIKSNLLESVHGRFDYILFNSPPKLLTQKGTKQFSFSIARQFAKQAHTRLKTGGVLYLYCTQENKSVWKKALSHFDVQTIGRTRSFTIPFVVLRATKKAP